MFRKYIKITKSKHPFLISAIFISLFLALLPSITIFIHAEYEKWAGIIFLLPSILLILISFIAFKVSDKYPLPTKIISGILNTAIITVIQIKYGIVAFFIVCLLESDYIYENINEYSKAIDSICYKEYVQHFPPRIPSSATDIKLYKTSSHWFGSEEIILKFKTDKSYIKNELAKNSYVYIEPPSKRLDRHKNFDFRLEMDNFTLYIINDYLSKKVEKIGPYHYGIAVNQNTSEICYYYINPD